MEWKPGRLQILTVIVAVLLINVAIILLQPAFVEVVAASSITGLLVLGMKVLESE